MSNLTLTPPAFKNPATAGFVALLREIFQATPLAIALRAWRDANPTAKR